MKRPLGWRRLKTDLPWLLLRGYSGRPPEIHSRYATAAQAYAYRAARIADCWELVVWDCRSADDPADAPRCFG